MKGILLVAATLSAVAFADERPQFRSGDIIFQTSSSKQSYAIMWASKSLYSHVGIIEEEGGKFFVLEAISKVSRTPLEKWVARGRLGRFAVRRKKEMTPEKSAAVIEAAKKYLGRRYDLSFTSKNSEIYCSELIELSFGGAGLRVGQTQKVRTLDVDNALVRKLFKSRWRKHPLCKGGTLNSDQCWQKVLDDELITPSSIAEDPATELIFSNYP